MKKYKFQIKLCEKELKILKRISNNTKNDNKDLIIAQALNLYDFCIRQVNDNKHIIIKDENGHEKELLLN